MHFESALPETGSLETRSLCELSLDTPVTRGDRVSDCLAERFPHYQNEWPNFNQDRGITKWAAAVRPVVRTLPARAS